MRNKKVIGLTAVVIILALVMTSLEVTGVTNIFHASNKSTTGSTTKGGVNYGPPTENEKKAGDEQKGAIVDRENKVSAAGSSTSTSEPTNVLITDAGQYDNIIEVRAFMPDYYHDGTCTITLTKDSFKVEKSTPAYRDASTTICTNPLFPRSEFAESGDWKVVVSYSSEGVSGTSTEKTIRIN